MNYSERLLSILSGIDKTENESDNGWWETSTGSKFGAKKLIEITDLLEKIKREAFEAGFDISREGFNREWCGGDYQKFEDAYIAGKLDHHGEIVE